MKLSKTIQVGSVRIPKGTVLNFGTEGLATYRGKRIKRSQIPALAVAKVSQRRNAKAALEHSIRFNGMLIPKGTVLNFGTEGFATYRGKRIKRSQIPAQAFASEALSPIRLKMPVCVNGTIIPAKESLMFDNSGHASYKGKQISIYDFPTAAIESEALDEAHNAVDIDQEFKAFDAIEPGDLGNDFEGKAIRFLGKAVGPAGYQALVDQFGNVNDKTIEFYTDGLSQEEIDALKFVAYSTTDGSVMVDIYDSVGGAVATEDDGEIVDINDVTSGDAAVNYDGKACTIVAKGQGAVWAENMAEQLGIDDCLKEIRESLDVDDDDSLEGTWFVLVLNDKGEKCIANYGPTGAKVIKSND